MSSDQLLEKTLFLSRICCFETLELETLFPLAEKLTERVFREGETIYEPEEAPHMLFFLVNGTVVLYNKNKEEIRTCREGDFFGDTELLANTHRKNFARCLENCTVYTLPSTAFFAALEESRKLSISFLNYYSKAAIAANK